MNMIEKVARAIAAKRYSDEDVNQTWKYFRHEAVAAIEAMREPSFGMRCFGADALRDKCNVNIPASAFQYVNSAMINAALDGK